MNTITDCIEDAQRQLHQCQTKESSQERLLRHVQARIKESKENTQAKLDEAPTDLEALLPILRELLDGNVKCFIIALETRDGIKVKHESRNSNHLKTELICKPRGELRGNGRLEGF